MEDLSQRTDRWTWALCEQQWHGFAQERRDGFDFAPTAVTVGLGLRIPFPSSISALPDEELRGRRTAVPNTIESSVGAGSC